MQLSRWIYGAWVLPMLTVVYCSWGEPGSSQYHIQTDEGPERYFRFQTDNGQFRKEKRLQDGTVIGTEAWIDAAGFLRQKDYIADQKGYRILKSKTVFVGQGRQIADAIKSTKSTPAQSGVLVDGTNGLSPNEVPHTGISKQAGYAYSTTTPLPPIASVAAVQNSLIESAANDPTKLDYLPPSEAAKIEPSPYLGFDHYPDELLPPKLPTQRHQHVHAVPTPRRRVPVVHIRPHSLPIEQDSREFDGNSLLPLYQHGTTPRPAPSPLTPSLAIEPPFENRDTRLRPIAVVHSTPAPITSYDAVEPTQDYGFSTPAPFRASPTIATKSSDHGYSYAPDAADEGLALPLDVNSLENGLLPPPPPAGGRHRYAHRLLHSNSLADDYDGVSVTQNGFRYVLPHQYHEEAQIDDKRAGSFGYVDPFGIRRVVYYNASPQRGFVHRNNNRYVGLGATPYDPIGPKSVITATAASDIGANYARD